MENIHQKTSARDFFLYLLAVGTLYVCVWRYIDLIFEYINISFPDIVERDSYDYDWPHNYALRSIRSSMATLLIVFPVYLGVTWFLRKDLIAHVEKRGLWIRKWLINVTLFLSAVMMITDLVTLVDYFLNGELTLRFVLKVLTVFFVAAIVFGYYLWDLRRETVPDSKPSRLLAVMALLLVFGSIGAGFFLIGTPGTQRTRRFDEKRVQHLQQIQEEVINYWQHKNTLPAVLEDLRSAVTGFAPPVDPETASPYEYLPHENLTFELCAVFSLASKPSDEYTIESKPIVPRAPLAHWNWRHNAGRHCFERTIDPDIYPPFPEKPLK